MVYFTRFRTSIWALFAATGAGAIALAGACASSTSPTGTTSNLATGGDAGGGGDAAKEKIVLGVVQDLTGKDKSLGVTLANSARVAQTQLNAVGGILGHEVEFRIVDDGSIPGNTEKVVRELIDGKVAGILGATTSDATLRVHQVAADAKVLLVSGSATTSTLTAAQPAKDRYFFRTVPTGDLQGEVLARFASGSAPNGDAGATPMCTNLALVFSDDAYGKPFAASVKRFFTEGGGKVVAEIPIPVDKKADYSGEVGLIVGAAPLADCVGLVTYLPAGVQFLKDYKKVTKDNTSRDWSKVNVIAGNTLNVAQFFVDGRIDPSDPNSPSVAEGVWGTNIDIAPQTAEFAYFKNLYFSSFPAAEGVTSPPRNTANFYDACILMALAVQKAGGIYDRVALRDALFSVSKEGQVFTPSELSAAFAALKAGIDINYTGASGPVDFDDMGNIKSDFIIWKASAGKFTTVQRVPAGSLVTP